MLGEKAWGILAFLFTFSLELRSGFFAGYLRSSTLYTGALAYWKRFELRSSKEKT